jgi:hypothetical protein
MPRATLCAVLFVIVGALLSCSRDLVTPSTHVLVGNAYDPANGCLNAQQSFDLVDGPAPGETCDVVCITDAKTGTVYVTNACPPFPALDTVESSDSTALEAGGGGTDPCAAALAAWAAGYECGAATDASADATGQGSTDASADDSSGDAVDATNDGSGGPADAGGQAS